MSGTIEAIWVKRNIQLTFFVVEVELLQVVVLYERINAQVVHGFLPQSNLSLKNTET